MAWTTPRTWVASEVVTSTLMNAHVRDNLSSLKTGGVSREDGVTSTVGNVGSGEDTLHSYSFSAGQLSANGDTIKAYFWGKTADNANVKDIQFRIDDTSVDTSILDTTLTIDEAGHWLAGFVAIRTSSTLCRASAQLVIGPANSPLTHSASNVTSAFTCAWANAVEVRLTGEATTTNDITVEGGLITLVAV